MKRRKYSIWAVTSVIIVLTATVLLFPVASNNHKLYSIVLYASISIVVFMLLFLIWLNIFATSNNKKPVQK